MSYVAEQMYEIFRTHYEKVFSKSLISIDQYNPHRSIMAFSKYLTGEAAQFEDLFPKYLFYGQDEDLLNLANLLRDQIKQIPSTRYKSYKTYLNSFLDFLTSVIESGNKQIRKIRNELVSVYHIDGNSELVEALGGIEGFLKKAIENSYFFDPTLVAERFKEIADLYSQVAPIPARWQADRESGIRTQCGYPACDIDTNGNAKVRQVIKDKTGNTVSTGASSIFVNYKISHIWGNAQNPLYFTNLWNLVLIPAWVNDLLDKATAPKGSVASKVLNTYKALCIKYYDMQSFSFNFPLVGLTVMPTENEPKDIIAKDKNGKKITYTFNSIGPKGNNTYAPITPKTLTI